MEFSAEEKYVNVSGRTLFIDGVRYLNYSCSAIEFTFTGKKAEAVLWTDWHFDENCKDMFIGFAAVFINGEMTQRFRLEETEKTYTLYESDIEQTVTVKLVKISEAAFGKMGVKKLIIDSEKPPVPTEKKQRRIEFIGDSITCGYGIEGVWNTDTFNTTQENPLKAYAARTANYFNADFNLISWSGIGVISRWVDETVNEPLNDWLMPMLYKHTDAGFSNDIKQNPFEPWDFKRFVPDVIVINLGTNDASYTRKIPEREAEFGAEYKNLLEFVRENNPKAHIFCAMGIMGQDLCGEIEKQVNDFSKLHNDDKIHFFKFDVQLESDGIGADWHPSETTQKKAAKKLISEIENVMNWN